MEKTEFKDVVADIQNMATWFEQVLETDYQSMNIRDKIKFMKMTQEVSNHTDEIREILYTLSAMTGRD